MKLEMRTLELLQFISNELNKSMINYLVTFEDEGNFLTLIMNYDLMNLLNILYLAEVDEELELGEDIHSVIKKLEEFLNL